MVEEKLDTVVEVPPFSAELAARTSELLDEPGVLGVEALERLVRRLAERPDLWQPLIVVDRERRRYELLYEDGRVDIWVLSWMPGQRTGFHDHDCSGVGLICVQGELDEGSLAIGAEPETVRMTKGVSRCGPGGYIHAVAHRAGEPAVSIHAYSPPLVRVGQYRRDAHGRLQREPEHGRKELLDHTISDSVQVRARGTTPPRTLPQVDDESREWLRSLRAEGAVRDEAVGRLHTLLLKAARHEVARRRDGLPHLRGDELDDIALEAADDAVVSVLGRLDDFRGLSRFTTWAYKFALLEAAVKLRRRAWQGRELPLEPESWDAISSVALQPDETVEQAELLTALRHHVATALTPHQRRVLLALAVDGVPIDVLAERLTTTRGALYKTLHDARRKLRKQLTDAGFELGDRSEEA